MKTFECELLNKKGKAHRLERIREQVNKEKGKGLKVFERRA